MRATRLALVAAGPILAALVWGGYALFGRHLVQAAYDGRLPLALLNGVITGQDLHPVTYHLARAGLLARRLVLALLVWGGLAGIWVLAAARRPTAWWAGPAGAMLPATALLWLLLLLQVPLFEALPGWFWPLRDKALPEAWVLGAVTVLGAVAARPAALHSGPGRRAARRWPVPLSLALLVLSGYAAHQALAWSEGRGLEAMMARLTDTGHAVFARVAVAGPGTGAVVSHYDELLADGSLPAYFHATKPPGLQAVVNLQAAVARRLLPGVEPLRALAGFAAVVDPLLGLLTLVPLYGLARLLLQTPAAEDSGADPGPAQSGPGVGRAGGGQAEVSPALLAAALYAVVPAVALVQLHADQFLHPLLGTAFLYLAARALRRGEAATGVAAGAVLAAGLWVSFALLALAPAVPVLAWVAWRRGQAAVWRPAAAVAAGLLGVYLLLWLACDYDAVARLRAALAAHRAAKPVAWSLGDRVYFGTLNLLELLVWWGLPLVWLAAADLAHTVRRRAWRAPTPADGLSLSLLAILPTLLAFGTTAGESARLWLFVVPLATLSAARALGRCSPPAAAGWVLALQWVTVLVVKGFQDFM